VSFGQYIVIPIFIAAQAFTMMLITPYIPGTPAAIGAGLITWISFQAWAMYFLAGCNPKMGAKTLAGYAGGIVASIAIFELGGALSGLNGATTPWGLYLAVFLVVVPVICAEKVPGLDFVPSWFVGAGVFFALMTYIKPPADVSKYSWYAQVATPELIACVMGLVYGHITVAFRKTYEAGLAAKAPAKVESKEAVNA
jgi:hypothetical protein